MQELIIAEKKYVVIELPGRPRALLDRTVAEIYEVETREINQAVKNNLNKFPRDFCFELTKEEFEEIKNFDLLSNAKFSNVLPKAFTWEGCNMLATILKSDVATQRAIQIVREFSKLEKAHYNIQTQSDEEFFAYAVVRANKRILELTEEKKQLAIANE